MNYLSVRKAVITAGTVLVAGCANTPGKPSGGLVNQVRDTFASDDPCSNNARNIGAAAGAVLGAVIGKNMGDGKTGVTKGIAVGVALGGLIGSDIDRKRCELSKVAKQYNLDMTFSAINANGEVVGLSTAASKASDGASVDKTVIGTTVNVRDKDSAIGHFESGSDQLTPKAKEYFAAIGAQYTSKTMLEAQTDPKRRAEVDKQIEQRRIVLIGHTDDTGSSEQNAALSEKRAKAVASFLKQQGILESALYFQGAGETLPTADNRTEAGRNANRRVEIVEVTDELNFRKYLEARKPDYQFYRPVDITSSGAGGKTATPSPSAKLATRPPLGPAKPSAETTTQAQPSITAGSKSPLINFGGSPYTPQEATLKVGELVPEKGDFTLLSKAYANDTVVLADCTNDRPRAAGSVKSLRDGRSYKTSEHMPQLFGKTWADNVNGNLVVINRLAILRDGGTPANLPELKVYSQYNQANSKKPMVNEEPRVNSYLVGQGVLYRIFPRGDGGLRCMDLLFATDGSTSAKGGKLVYTTGTAQYVANIKLQVQ